MFIKQNRCSVKCESNYCIDTLKAKSLHFTAQIWNVHPQHVVEGGFCQLEDMDYDKSWYHLKEMEIAATFSYYFRNSTQGVQKAK